MKTQFAILAISTASALPWGGAWVGAWAGAQNARADTVVLTSVADNTIIEDPAGTYSCGAAQYFFAGRVGINGGSTLRRGAVRFDFSSIPAGSVISSVSLRMYCSAAGQTVAQTINLKRFQVSWGEGASVAFGGGGALAMTNDVTWLHRLYPATLWTTPGGQFNPAVSSARSVGGVGYYTWPTSTQLVADVQAMLNANATNFGWCVLGNETTLQSVKRFDARESGVAASRPQLTVVYFPPTSYDLTGDNKINASDLAILLGSWGGSGAADFNHDGVVAAQDLSLLLSAWTG
ncbi:MAG: DNRLRE domain-containing protein [Planctomycetota bacterium]